MSDIIYTPPASGGGGQNPTTNFIPLNNGTSSFVDSSIYNDNISLSTIINGQYLGISLQQDIRQFIFGEYNGDYNNTIININDPNKYIFFNANPINFLIDGLNNVSNFNYNGNDVGLKLDFVNHIYSFADFDNIGNGTSLIINDSNELIKTKHQSNDIGLKLDFSNKIFSLGDFYNANNNTLLSIDDPNANIFLGNLGGNTSGFRYNYLGNGGNNFNYITIGAPDDGIGITINYAGGVNDLINLTSFRKVEIFSNNSSVIDLQAIGTYTNKILLDPAADKISFTTNQLNFVGAGLITNTAGGSSNKHLVLTIQGTQYKIALLNP